MVGGDLGSLGGRYRVGNRLGEGPVGAVYQAEDTVEGRPVAVKVLRDEIAADPARAERVLRAARAQAALAHPAVARVIDQGQEGSRYFVVSELVAGTDLSTLIERSGSFSLDRCSKIAMQVCEALEHAHAAGTPHLDLRASDVLIGDGDKVKVTDFGLARAAFTHTLDPGAGGTDYTAPELTTGEGAGPEADIYSLGAILFHALTGEVPFPEGDPRSVALRHVREGIPLPSSRNRDVPPSIDLVVRRATAADPHERFPDAGSFREALAEPAREKEAVSVAPAPGEGGTADGYTVWPIPGRAYDPHRLGRRVIAVLVTLALVALGAFLWRVTAGTDPEDRPKISPPPTPIEITFDGSSRTAS